MSLIRAGIKMKALIPPEAKDKINGALHDKGIDFDIDTMKNEDIEELIEALGDMEVDIEGRHGEKFKVYVE
jgi:dihydropteroate synthase